MPEPHPESVQNYRLTSCFLDKYLVKVSTFASGSSPRISINDLRDGMENTVFYYPLSGLPIGKGVVSQLICLVEADAFQLLIKHEGDYYVLTYSAVTPENAATRLHSIMKIGSVSSPIFGLNSSVVRNLIYSSVLQMSPELTAQVLRIRLDGPKALIDTSQFAVLQSGKEVKLELKAKSKLSAQVTLEDWSKGQITLKPGLDIAFV